MNSNSQNFTAFTIYSLVLIALAIGFTVGCSQSSDASREKLPKSEEPARQIATDTPDAAPSVSRASNPARDDNLLSADQTFGRYIGVLKHSKIEYDQLAKLDFIMSQDDGETLRLKAVLSVYFGDFNSDEYVSYHYHDVKFNLLTRTLVFDQADQDLTLTSIQFEEDVLEADIRTAFSGAGGTLYMERMGIADPTRPLLSRVWGDYSGTCGGQPKTLQLVTYRTTNETTRVGNPFGTYNIRGSVADQSTYSCSKSGKACVTDIIEDGSYNFFESNLTLFGKIHRYNCRVRGTELDCGTCQFSKRNPIAVTLKKPNMASNDLIGNALASTDSQGLIVFNTGLAGHYSGYLHHERLDQYQSGSLNITTYQQPDGSGQSFKMSAVANLYFGDHESPERITYNFNPRNYNLLSPVFMFERDEDDVDALLQVVSFKDGVIKGVWHSLQFGRVGTFEFRKGGLGEGPASEKLMKPIAGIYVSNNLELYLDTRRDRTPVNSWNPFFPIVFGGYLVSSPTIPLRKPISGGSYDFYTGKIAFEIENQSTVLAGSRDATKEQLRLHKPATDINRVQQVLNLLQFDQVAP